MGCRKLTYYETDTTPLKVATGTAFKSEKVVQGLLRVDPLAADYPYLTPYNYAGNKPITHKDIDGLQSTGDEPVNGGGNKSVLGDISPGQEVNITNTDNYTWTGGSSNTGEQYIPDNGPQYKISDNICYKFRVRESTMKQIFPNAKSEVLENVTKYLNLYMEDFGIDSNDKLAHFLSQAGHETGGFKKSSVTEGLYYTTKDRLKQIYPSKFKGEGAKKASDYLKSSKKLANLVYGGKYGNSDEASGEGYKYRGRGLFQLTFKDNYESFDNYMKKNYGDTSDLVANPDLVGSDIRYSVLSALWFFETRVLNRVDMSNATVRDVTRKINPGMAGIKDRTNIYNRASKILQ